MKTNTITAVPRLRFPEFRDDDSWCKKKLIDVANKNVRWSFIGGPFGSNLKASDYTNKGVRVIQLQNIGDGEFINDSKIYTSEEKADELLANNIYPHDIIMSKMGDPVGRASLIPDTHPRYVMCSDGIRLVVDEDKYSKYFVYSFINSDPFRASVESKSTGSTRKRIGLSHLKTLPILIPTLAEQQKIADCLSSLDDSIDAELQQLEVLKLHKAGLLQNLFPVGEETVPNYRFAEFKDDGDWKAISLSKFITQRSTFAENGIPLYSLTIEKGVTPKTERYERSHLVVNNKEEAYKIVYSNDFVYNPMNLRFGAIAKHSGENTVSVSKYYNVFYSNDEVDSSFLEMYLQSSVMLNVYNDIATGSLIEKRRVHFSEFLKLTMLFPNVLEQQKISDSLSSLANLIESQFKKIEILKQHKQGLMQQLFPMMDDK